jgi:cytosine/adenosine deaminase-related metal-dependent hydrolase/ubiquinone/menaquinone biosynthesis C-methylase UbiE
MIALSTATSSVDIFDRWAEVYDHQANPLLGLEERTLPTLLPSITGSDVLDAGCGTGRWLKRFEALAPNSLTGTDCSAAMLERARQKVSPSTTLHLGYASSLPGGNNSSDLIIASFVLSYIDDLVAFAKECARILRPGGHLLLCDMHPNTAALRGWTRTFQAGDTKLSLPAVRRFLPLILSTFAQSGFRLIQLTEPCFGEPERQLFTEAGKLSDYTNLADMPAIYLLKLQRLGNLNSLDRSGEPLSQRRMENRLGSNVAIACSVHSSMARDLLNRPCDVRLTNAAWATNAATWSHTPLSILRGLVSTDARAQSTIDLAGYVLLPGLINAHDHLEFALFPNLGRASGQPPFRNAREWATEIHQLHAETISRHLQVPLDTRLWWGAIRNLLSGVTTVCHHNPIHVALTAPEFPIRVVTNFGWAHSLAFESDLVARYNSTCFDSPFIVHAAEGTDSQSANEIIDLDRLNILDDRTVLVHGLALTPRQVALLNERGTAVILCPTSNQFLFNRTLSAELLAVIERKALGSDSPLTASGDLLDEIQRLHTDHAVDLPIIYDLVTRYPAAILRFRHGEGGCISRGSRADLVAVRDLQTTPAQTLAQLSFADIELVVLAGRIQVASSELYARLPERHRLGLHALQVEGVTRYVRAPLPDLFQQAQQVLGRDHLCLGNKEVRYLRTL